MAEGKTGTRDATYDLISVAYHALQGAETYEIYRRDAADNQDLERFFADAKDQQSRIADRAKDLLRQQLRE